MKLFSDGMTLQQQLNRTAEQREHDNLVLNISRNIKWAEMTLDSLKVTLDKIPLYCDDRYLQQLNTFAKMVNLARIAMDMVIQCEYDPERFYSYVKEKC